MPRKPGLTTSLTAAVVVFAFAVVHAGVSRAQTANMTPALKELAAAADKEGELLVKWGAGSFGGARGATLLAKKINQAYGTKIRIKWAPGGSFPAMGSEVAIAFRNKQPSPTDAYIGFSRNMAVYLKHDMFQKGDYKKYLPDRMTDAVVERDTYVKIYTGTIGFTYNKARAPSVPERLTDFLEPEWKGKIATTPFAAGFEQLAAKEVWGVEKAIDYSTKLSAQLAGFILCPEAERVASGEFLAFLMDCGGGPMMRAAARGAPLVRVLAPDVPIVSYFYLAVPKNATNPNAAKLFITYVLSKDGQRDSYKMMFADLHLFPESKILKEMRMTEKKYGIKYQSVDIGWQESANNAGNAAQRKIQKILRRGRRR